MYQTTLLRLGNNMLREENALLSWCHGKITRIGKGGSLTTGEVQDTKT